MEDAWGPHKKRVGSGATFPPGDRAVGVKDQEAVSPHVPDESRYISHILAVLPKTESLVCSVRTAVF
jgi:hypothetical protein